MLAQTITCHSCDGATMMAGAFLWNSHGEIIGKRFHCADCGHTEDYA